MQYFSESYFRAKAYSLYEARALTRKADTGEYANFDIFLSYNINDRSVVKGIFADLESKGYRVYLDFVVDPQLIRENCSKETARLLRERLRHSRALIYASSINALGSKWMAWELGEMDGRGRECFILPVSNDGSNKEFEQKEYLKLYPIISKDIYGSWRLSDNSYSQTRPFNLSY